jgi:hypothetical protein
VKSSTKYDPLSDRRGLADALVPSLPPTHTVPTKPTTIPVSDLEGCEDFATGQVSLESLTVPVLICASRSNRGSIKITNLSTVDIWIGKTVRVSATSGDLLPGGRGQWISLPTKASIWALPSALNGGASSTPTAVSFSEVY